MQATIKPGRIEQREQGWCVVVGANPVGFPNMQTYRIDQYFATEQAAREMAAEHGLTVEQCAS
jgi:hypothetical protein